ncbi:MAG: hypothetical protein ACYCYM_10715 [Saccharofermentanales bacterium]
MRKIATRKLLSLILSAAMIIATMTLMTGNAVNAEANNGWTIISRSGTPAGNVSVSSSGSATSIAFSSAYDWGADGEQAVLTNRLMPVDFATYAFKFKADDLTGGWIPFCVGWSPSEWGVLNANGILFTAENGNKLKIKRTQGRPADEIISVDVDLAVYNTIEIWTSGTSTIHVAVNGTVVYTFDEADFYTMATGASNYSTGLSLSVGGGASTAITFDSNATQWIAQGTAPSNVLITGGKKTANINFLGGDFGSVYAQTVANTFKNLRTGLWGYTFKLNSLQNWGGMTLNWAVDNTPIFSSSGVFLAFELGGTKDYKLTPKIMSGAPVAIDGALSADLSFSAEVAIIIQGDDQGHIQIFCNGESLVSYTDASMSNLALEYPLSAELPGLTLSTGGGGTYNLVIKEMILDADKIALEELIAACQTLHDGTQTGTAVGQVAEADKTALNDAILAAQAVSGNEFALQADVDAAVAALGNARTAFLAAIIKSGDTTGLAATVAEAEALLLRITESATTYTLLADGITAARIVLDDPLSVQPILDSTSDELDSLMTTAAAPHHFWAVDLLPDQTGAGIIVSADGYQTTFDTLQGTFGVEEIETDVVKQENGSVVFNINPVKRAGNADEIWQAFVLSSPADASGILARMGVRLVFGGSYGNGEVWIQNNDALVPDAKIGHFSFRENYELQFAFAVEDRDSVETLVIRVDGLEIASTANAAHIQLFKENLAIGFASGGNNNRQTITTIDLTPAVIRPNVAHGDFIAAGPAGTGTTDGAYVTKDGDMQVINFVQDKGDVTTTTVRTILDGPFQTFEFSFKVIEHSSFDWHALILTDNLTWTGINSPGIVIAIAGSDYSVQFREYGDGGQSGASLWNKDVYSVNGKKMRIKLELAGDELVTYYNGEEVSRVVASDRAKAIFNGNSAELAMFGSAGFDSQFEISYINKEDPVPFDSLEEEVPDETTEIYSLDDTKVLVEDKTVTILEDMTIEDLISYLYLEEGYDFHFYDADNELITDYALSALTVKSIFLVAGENEIDLYTVMDGTTGGGSSNGSSEDNESPQTGDSSLLYLAMLLMISIGVAVPSIMKSRKAHRISEE